MLALNATIKKRLVGVINGLTRDRSLREDLMQEAMIHFWKAECERPGQTVSWYLQSCYFHLRHCLKSGRSIDSSRRRSLRIELPADGDLCDCLEWGPVEQSVVAEVEVRESIRLLRRHLSPRERAILLCLAEGLRPREIARHLLLSHPTVNKCRRKIADLAIRLGIGPWRNSRVPVRVSREKDPSTALRRRRRSLGFPSVPRNREQPPETALGRETKRSARTNGKPVTDRNDRSGRWRTHRNRNS